MMYRVIGWLALRYALATPQHRGKWRALHIIDRLFGPFELRTPKNGVMLTVFVSSTMDVSYFRVPEPEDIVRRMIHGLPQGGVYVDVGANCGFLAAISARIVGESGLVIAIEPSAREFRRLLDAIALNGIHNVIPVKAALASEAAPRHLYLEASHTGLNRLAVGAPKGIEQTAELVDGDTGTAVLRRCTNDRRVNLVKIDVEGAEMEVLQGLADWIRDERPAQMLVEVTPRWLRERGTSKEELFEFMCALGYRATVLSDTAQYDELFVLSDAP